MILPSPLVSSRPLVDFDLISKTTGSSSSSNKASVSVKKQLPSLHANTVSSVSGQETPSDGCSPQACRFCSSIGRRRLLQAAATSVFVPILPTSAASTQQQDYMAKLREVHPPRPDWYEEFYASVMSSGMESYEAEIAAYKSHLFDTLRMVKAKKVVEVGIGTGPNLKYYAGESDVEVLGVDPNSKMEKYARESAAAARLPPANFQFLQAVGEAIPLGDDSVDAVVGTLVLCSVKDVGRALQEIKRVLKPGGIYLFVEHVAAKDGTLLRLVQNFLDPLQQTVADGCHLTRKTGDYILNAGFKQVDLNMAFLSNASLINPHVYGIAKNMEQLVSGMQLLSFKDLFGAGFCASSLVAYNQLWS